MAISISLPLQAAQYIPTSTSFSADFALGVYDFGVAGNENISVLPLEINSFYLIERMFISGNLAAEDYLSSLGSAVPLLQIKTLRGKTSCHVRKIPVVQFTTNRESPIFIKSDKKGDELLMSFEGIVNQIDATVGLDPMILTIGLSIYQINEKYYNQGMRTALSSQFGLNRKISS